MARLKVPMGALLFMQLLLLSTPSLFVQSSEDGDRMQELISSIESHGGAVNLVVGQECGDVCIRGTFSSLDRKIGELVLAVPLTAVVWLEHTKYNIAFNAEVVHPLMVEMHQNPEHNKTHGLFWDLMPPPEELFTEEMFTPKQISMIQSELLEDRVAYAIQSVQEIYYGNYTSPNENARKLPPLEDVIGPGKVSLEQFRYFASLVTSRDYGYGGKGKNKGRKMMVPIADMINHGDDFNVHRYDNKTHVVYIARKEIKAGEPLISNYMPGVLHRNDISLITYGFVQHKDPPLLWASDLPEDLLPNVYDQTPPDDSSVYGPNGKYNTWEEHARLKEEYYYAIDRTTEEEDEALLAQGMYDDWKEKTIIECRLLRKRALRRAMAAIEAELGNNVDRSELR